MTLASISASREQHAGQPARVSFQTPVDTAPASVKLPNSGRSA